MLSSTQKILKRSFDFLIAFLGLLLLFIPLCLLIIISNIITKKIGLFKQNRVGQYGKIFKIYKIRTIKGNDFEEIYIPQNSKYISKFGYFLRRYNIDELPQLFNILLGTMSFVGPRPDLKGFADNLKLKDQLFLKVKPGITSPASIKYRDENSFLSQQSNPSEYYKNVVWPDKVKMNNEYVKNWSFLGDIKLILLTIFS